MSQDAGEKSVQPQTTISRLEDDIIRDSEGGSLGLPVEPLRDAESRRPSATEGQIDSAMGIAQKVGGAARTSSNS